MRCLYIGYDFTEGKVGGDVVRKNNYKILKSIEELEVNEYFIKNDKTKRELLLNFFKFSFNGGTEQTLRQIQNVISVGNYSHVFFDGSLYGKLVKKIKKSFPSIKLITFFHNIEYNYYLDRVKAEGFINAIALPSVRYNEKLSAKYSDEIIVLSERDKINLYKSYRTEATNIIPISLKDELCSNVALHNSEYDYLFIGSNFYANIHGISWFIKEVLPFVPGKLLVIGRGMQQLTQKFKNSKKLHIYGEVDDLKEFYNLRTIIVSPIFYGSGMKTKTIEALMYGKTIVGTNEAFIGIQTKKLTENFICNTKEDFIDILSKKDCISMAQVFNNESRDIYLNNFTIDSSIVKIKRLFH